VALPPRLGAPVRTALKTDLTVSETLSIPRDEVAYATSRSSGPGGQNVNKVETRVTLLFDLEASRTLSDEQRGRLRRRLATRITRRGVLRVVSQRHRTQAANRKAVDERFTQLLADALTVRKPRRETRSPESAKRRRLEDKKQRSQLKRMRRKPESD
jgi:ribosome-associated protein